MISLRPAVMKALLRVLVVGSLLGVVVLLAFERSEAAPPFFQINTTAETYAQQCAACHGVDGEGGVGPSLQTSTMSAAELAAIIRDGSSTMPAFAPTLSEEELEAVTAFVVVLQGADAADGGVEQGAAVFAEECADCHGDDAEGGVGPNLKTIALARDDLIVAVRDGKGTMPAFADQIDADDIEAVVAFLAELSGEGDEPAPSHESGATLFADNCSRCHGPDAAGGVGPALKTSRLTTSEMVSVISNGRGAMTGFSAIISSEDIETLVAYVDATRAGDGGAVAAEGAIGQETYLATCSSCHGLDGLGGLGPPLASTRLTANEIISQVFGGHSPEMPAFEGVLDPVQAQEVAQYVLSIEGEATSRIDVWVLFLVAAVIAVAVAVGLWYTGALDRLWRRSS